ncbi:MAG: GNAT family N-acetyltransferase [Alphaproteobacteria bacterium]|nr:GNAT family N-acetyltransferase [Alphaproteobacteria bacterium]MBF0251226.1 GNAT family N-acetyltransferase [Alphaproteobacteria bacterium]
MLCLITPNRANEFAHELEEMHRLRYRVFRERLEWEVNCHDGMESDEYDAFDPTYLLARDNAGGVAGCIRLLPTTGPNMLRDTFPQLLGGHDAPNSPDIWESSRFALDVNHGNDGRAITRATSELFAGMIEFGLAMGLSAIVTVTDVRVERILKRSGWPLERIGEPLAVGNTTAIAGYLPTNWESLGQVRRKGDLAGPVLWQPFVPEMPAAA